MTKFITISGFLGAGKTTAIAALARTYQDMGKTVAIITNDQGSDLVDTQFLRSLGFVTEEISGGCFCCNFSTMIDTAIKIHDQWQPDVLLAEAVGSCTDLYATVVKPLAQNHKDRFQLAPLVTMADPGRINEVFDSRKGLFTHEVDYLYSKQLEESQRLVLTKSDLYDSEIITKALDYLTDMGIQSSTQVISAKKNNGILALAQSLLLSEYENQEIIELDYNTYTLAEKDLGWFNMLTNLNNDHPFSFNDFAEAFIDQIHDYMQTHDNEIAHLKLYAKHEKDFSKISLTANSGHADFNRVMNADWSDYELYINARINSSPEIIHQLVASSLDAMGDKFGYDYDVLNLEFFQPGDPDPEARVKNLSL